MCVGVLLHKHCIPGIDQHPHEAIQRCRSAWRDDDLHANGLLMLLRLKCGGIVQGNDHISCPGIERCVALHIHMHNLHNLQQGYETSPRAVLSAGADRMSTLLVLVGLLNVID